MKTTTTNQVATWAIFLMPDDSDDSENYAVTRNGEHVISRVHLSSALDYVCDLAADDDQVLSIGGDWTGRTFRNINRRGVNR
jgi:hypothetical protein